MMAPPAKLFSVRLFPLLCLIAWTSLNAVLVNGIRILECNGGNIDIREDNNPVNSITCEGFTATQMIQWTLYSDGAEQAVIRCGANDLPCNPPYDGITVTRPNITHSVLVLETLHRVRLGNGYINCRVEGTTVGTSCNTRVIGFANGLRIPECIGGNIDIREDNNPANSITCEGFTATQGIQWTLYGEGAEQVSITCGPANQTCSHSYNGITVTRPNSTYSVLVLETLHRARLGNGYISCGVDGLPLGTPPFPASCNARVIGSASAQPASTSATTSPQIIHTESSTTFQQVSSVTTTPVPPTPTQVSRVSATATETSPSPVTSPPPSSLTLSGYSPDTELSEGDRVSLTCTVTDGVPPVSSVTVLCGRHSNTCYTQPSEEETTVSCSLVMLTIRTEDDGVICVCFAERQGQPDAYSLSDRVTLSVRTTAGTSSNTVAYIGGGVTAALVLIAAIVVGALLYWRYRNRTLYDRPQPRRQEDPYTDLVVYESVGQPSQTQQHDQKSSRPAAAADKMTAEYENTKTGTALQAS